VDTNKGKTMTTLIELQARVADLDQQIAEWYERIAEIKSERAALAYHAIDYLHGERAALARKVSNWQEVAECATRRKANRIARRWGVTWEDDSYRESGYYNHLHYFPKPDFIEGADPLGDGHYAHNWDETLWLVEFYARHNPEHPDHDQREYLEIAPHC
jgi:hypothetical protein